MTVGTFVLWALLRDDSGYLPGARHGGARHRDRPLLLRRSPPRRSPPCRLDQSSLAGGILYMFQIAGGAVGLGLSTAAFLLGTNQGVDDQVSKFHISFTSVQRSSVRGALAGTDSAKDLLVKFSHGVGEQLTPGGALRLRRRPALGPACSSSSSPPWACGPPARWSPARRASA